MSSSTREQALHTIEEALRACKETIDGYNRVIDILHELEERINDGWQPKAGDQAPDRGSE